MQRKKSTRLPDVINFDTSQHFTQIPNETIRDESISFKAKGILAVLLSNKKGWVSYMERLQKCGKEGVTAIRSGIDELKDNGYLIKIRYRDKDTKNYAGSFWGYTSTKYNFNTDAIQQTYDQLDDAGFYPSPPVNELPEWLKGLIPEEKLHAENLNIDKLDLGNLVLRILKDKNIKIKKTKEDRAPQNKSRVPYSKILEAYNEILGRHLPQALKYNSTRKKQVKARWDENEEYQDIEWWRYFFSSVLNMPFLLGNNDRGWTADFEWLTKASNFLKVLEGKYVPSKNKRRNGQALDGLGTGHIDYDSAEGDELEL